MYDALTEAAQEDYFDLARIAWKSELVSSSELHKRLRVLDDLRGRDGSWTYNPIWVRRSDFVSDECVERSSEAPCFPETSHHESDRVEHTRDGSTPLLYLIVQLASDEWKFHKGDADPYPSVPHGHGKNDERNKLDAYLGYTYIEKEPNGRLKKSEIITLWNNDKFRDFAREALNHFISGNPNYNFRVGKPLRLPRKR